MPAALSLQSPCPAGQSPQRRCSPAGSPSQEAKLATGGPQRKSRALLRQRGSAQKGEAAAAGALQQQPRQENDLAVRGPLLFPPPALWPTILCPDSPPAASRRRPGGLAGAALLRLPTPRGGSTTAGRLKQFSKLCFEHRWHNWARQAAPRGRDGEPVQPSLLLPAVLAGPRSLTRTPRPGGRCGAGARSHPTFGRTSSPLAASQVGEPGEAGETRPSRSQGCVHGDFRGQCL